MASRERVSTARTAGIVGAALLLRFLVVAFVARAHSAEWFFDQATELGRLAESVYTGHGFSSPFGGDTGPSAFLSPGYPILVASIFAIFQPYSWTSAVALMSLQACFGAATVWALIRFTERVMGSSLTATIAGVLSAVALPMLWLPTLFWETSLSVLLATTAMLLAVHCAEHPSLGKWLCSGVYLAFSLAVNPSLLPILLCCFGWAMYQSRLQPLWRPALGICLCMFLSAPWAIRNYRQLHALIPLRDNLGYEMWQGNRPGSDGFFFSELHPNTNAEELTRLTSLGEAAYMRQKQTVAAQAIAADPGRFVTLTLKRACYFWVGGARHSTWPIVTYISGTSAFGLAGLLLLWRRDRRVSLLLTLPLILFPLPYYVTHPDFRFRLVLDPLLLSLTAYALVESGKTRMSAEADQLLDMQHVT